MVHDLNPVVFFAITPEQRQVWGGMIRRQEGNEIFSAWDGSSDNRRMV